MKWMSTALFEVLWKLITGSWILVAFRRGWGASSTDPPTREELARRGGHSTTQRCGGRSIADRPGSGSGADSVIRDAAWLVGELARLVAAGPIRPDRRVGPAESGIQARPISAPRAYATDSAGVAALLERGGSVGSDSGDDGARNAGRRPNARTRQGRGRRDPNLRVESAEDWQTVESRARTAPAARLGGGDPARHERPANPGVGASDHRADARSGRAAALG